GGGTPSSGPGTTPSSGPGQTTSTSGPGVTPGGATPAKVLKAVRFGFHHQPTLLVVTYSDGVQADAAADAANYTVWLSSNGAHHAVPISRVFYNPVKHKATLR